MPRLEVPASVAPRDGARIIIATDVPAKVERVNEHPGGGAYGAPDPDDVLCAETPCIVTLPRGDYSLRFRGLTDDERTSTALLEVRNGTQVLNHTLGQN